MKHCKHCSVPLLSIQLARSLLNVTDKASATVSVVHERARRAAPVAVLVRVNRKTNHRFSSVTRRRALVAPMLAREHDRVTLVAQPVPGPDFRLVQHVHATTYLLWYVMAVKARLSARIVLRTALAADPVTSLELTHSRHLWRRLRPVHGRRGQRATPSLACPHARFFFCGNLRFHWFH